MSRTVQLASALLALGHIPHEHAKQMSAHQIISLYQFDHYPIRKTDGGPYEPWNLVPRLIVPHREKTAKLDVPQIAKGKRLRRAEAEHKAKMGSPELDRALHFLLPRASSKRRIRSRGFDPTKTRGFDRKVRERRHRGANKSLTE